MRRGEFSIVGQPAKSKEAEEKRRKEEEAKEQQLIHDYKTQKAKVEDMSKKQSDNHKANMKIEEDITRTNSSAHTRDIKASHDQSQASQTEMEKKQITETKLKQEEHKAALLELDSRHKKEREDFLKERKIIMDIITKKSVASLNAALQKHRLETKEAASREKGSIRH